MKKTIFAALLAISFVLVAAAPLRNSVEQQVTFERTFEGAVVNAANDTLLMPATFTSIWNYNITVDATSPADTSTSIIVIVQESNTRTGGLWYEVERDTLTQGSAAASIAVRLHGLATGGYIKGVRQRIILDGQGTQKGYYTATAVLKRAN
jgi:hypothetical protein